MRKSPANHIHRYKKVNLSRNKVKFFVYRCILPTCPSYIPVHLSEGKLCECNRCYEPMLITKAVIQGSSGRALTLPHCVNCTKRKRPNEIEAITEFLSKITT